MEASNNEPRATRSVPHTMDSAPHTTDPTTRSTQPNSLASFPTVSSLSPKPEGSVAGQHCPSGTTTFPTSAAHAVTDDEFACTPDGCKPEGCFLNQDFPPPYPVHEEAPLAVAPTAEQRQTNVVKALQGKMADFISGSSQRHYRTIVRELSDRQIPLNLLSDESKAKGLAQMLEEDVCSLSELVILGQFAKAIDDSDTRAAEFLRDTAGYKPQTDVTVEHKTQGLASLTDTQLLTLLQALNPEQGALPEEVNNG